jgi:triosephosphate isomerase
MMMTRKTYVAGNWKMNGVGNDLDVIEAISAGAAGHPTVDVAICVPATLIERAARAVPQLPIGGQDVHQDENGAHTGCISARMLVDAGARVTIVGHSERREAQCESDELVRAKAERALSTGLGVILCVGEALDIREKGKAVETVAKQLDASLPRGEAAEAGVPGRFAIAYEPIWAIGTGKLPTVDEIGEMHSALRQRLVEAYDDCGNEIRILYGGSVKASNAAEIFAVEDVDGALVGGASLQASDFLPIVDAAAVSRG